MFAGKVFETEASAIARYVYADYAAGDLDAVKAAIADDARLICHVPREAVTPFGGVWIGPDGLEQYLAALAGAFDHQSWRVLDIVDHGCWAVVLLFVDTIHRDSGARIQSNFVQLVRTQGEQIAEFHEFINVGEIHAAIRRVHPANR